jgi:hypothetical protein
LGLKVAGHPKVSYRVVTGLSSKSAIGPIADARLLELNTLTVISSNGLIYLNARSGEYVIAMWAINHYMPALGKKEKNLNTITPSRSGPFANSMGFHYGLQTDC